MEPTETVNDELSRKLDGCVSGLMKHAGDCPGGEQHVESAALEKYRGEIDQISRRLRVPRDLPPMPEGLTNFRCNWNESVKDESVHEPRRRKILTNTYRWLQGRANIQQKYQAELDSFINRTLIEPTPLDEDGLVRQRITRRPRTATIHALELALGGITNEIEREMPDIVLMVGEGEVKLKWTDYDAELRWTEPQTQPIGLHNACVHAFSVYGQMPDSEARWFTFQLEDEIARRHQLVFPHFTFPAELEQGVRPATLVWTHQKTEPVPETDLPDWILASQEVSLDLPTGAGLDLYQRDRDLAALVDDVVFAAAREDWERTGLEQKNKPQEDEDEEEQEEPSRAVRELVETIADRSGREPQEVLELFARALQRRQKKTAAEDECAANTAALAFILSLLNAR